MQKQKSATKQGQGGDSPSQLIDARIKELRDWRGGTLARLRTLIKEADPEVIEEWKWRGVPVWSPPMSEARLRRMWTLVRVYNSAGDRRWRARPSRPRLVR
jgi:hypothetical protein